MGNTVESEMVAFLTICTVSYKGLRGRGDSGRPIDQVSYKLAGLARGSGPNAGGDTPRTDHSE